MNYVERINCHSIVAYVNDNKIQKIIAIEEMSELMKEISKELRGKPDIDAITEEIADVTIMLEQLIFMYGIQEDKLYEVIDEKLARTLTRVKFMRELHTGDK